MIAASSGVGVTFGAGQGPSKAAGPGSTDSKVAQIKKVCVCFMIL